MHWHPEHLIYTLSFYKVQDIFPDGNTKTMERRAGELLWGEELNHATQNIGETSVQAPMALTQACHRVYASYSLNDLGGSVHTMHITIWLTMQISNK